MLLQHVPYKALFVMDTRDAATTLEGTVCPAWAIKFRQSQLTSDLPLMSKYHRLILGLLSMVLMKKAITTILPLAMDAVSSSRMARKTAHQNHIHSWMST
jgi:hypothetical protein